MSGPTNSHPGNCKTCGVAAWWRITNYLKNKINIAQWRITINKLTQIFRYLNTSPAAPTPLASKPTPSPPPPVMPPIYRRFLAGTSSLVEPFFFKFDMPSNATEEGMKVHSLPVGFATSLDMLVVQSLPSSSGSPVWTVLRGRSPSTQGSDCPR